MLVNCFVGHGKCHCMYASVENAFGRFISSVHVWPNSSFTVMLSVDVASGAFTLKKWTNSSVIKLGALFRLALLERFTVSAAMWSGSYAPTGVHVRGLSAFGSYGDCPRGIPVPYVNQNFVVGVGRICLDVLVESVGRCCCT